MAVDAFVQPSSRAVIPVRLLGDPALALRAVAGDEAAYGEIYRRFHEPLLRYCRSLLLSVPDAEDAVQSTMAAALRSLPGEKRSIQLRAWLFRVAHNQCVDLLRARRTTAGLEEAAELGDTGSVAADAETRARLRDLVADRQKLSKSLLTFVRSARSRPRGFTSRKGKPVARRGRKTRDLAAHEAAQSP